MVASAAGPSPLWTASRAAQSPTRTGSTSTHGPAPAPGAGMRHPHPAGSTAACIASGIDSVGTR
jgi:hypothetical protein